MLRIVYSDEAGLEIVLPVSLEGDGTVVVGRSKTCDVRIDNRSVSRKHAKITREGDAWSVRDLGSSNHTYVNGDEVTTSPFAIGDVLRFGDVVTKVEQGEGSSSSPASSKAESSASGKAKARTSGQPKAKASAAPAPPAPEKDVSAAPPPPEPASPAT